jgi:DUF2891 family protein
MNQDTAARFAQLALDCVHREYPNKIAHTLASDADALPPRVLTPAFYGCFDWHSAVHGHWMLARLARVFPESAFCGCCESRACAQHHSGEHRGRGAIPRSSRADRV